MKNVLFILCCGEEAKRNPTLRKTKCYSDYIMLKQSYTDSPWTSLGILLKSNVIQCNSSAINVNFTKVILQTVSAVVLSWNETLLQIILSSLTSPPTTTLTITINTFRQYKHITVDKKWHFMLLHWIALNCWGVPNKVGTLAHLSAPTCVWSVFSQCTEIWKMINSVIRTFEIIANMLCLMCFLAFSALWPVNLTWHIWIATGGQCWARKCRDTRAFSLLEGSIVASFVFFRKDLVNGATESPEYSQNITKFNKNRLVAGHVCESGSVTQKKNLHVIVVHTYEL